MLSLVAFATLVVAQAQTSPLPSTGNSKLDTAIWFLSGLLGLREGTHWWDRVRKRGNGKQLELLADGVAKTVKAQGETVAAVKDLAGAVDKVHDQVAELRVQVAEIRGKVG